jgi:hypothetical protein
MIYNLQEIYEIRKNMISYVLPSEIMQKIQSIEKEIGIKSIPERNTSSYSSSNYDPNRRLPPSSSNNNTTNHFRTSNRPSSFQGTSGGRGSHSFSKTSSRGSPQTDDLSWENVRNFKTTKLEKKEGIDKKINDIRICLNKISAKNYDTQKETIFQHIQSCLNEEEEEEDPDTSISSESVRKEALQKVATAIFDIASTNKFFSEIYAKLYKSLIEISPVFHEILDSFVMHFMDSLQEIKYVDPNIDYDAFCAYNKQNDKRKASAIFMIHMMKVDILAISQVVPILSNLVVKIEENMETANRLNEVEEMTEVLFLFLQEGFTFLFHATSERIEIDSIFAKIRTFATYKIKDKPSLSSRVIFKYMDLVGIMNKNDKK